jgi:hypothetical protein
MQNRGHQERLHGGHQSVAAGCSTFTMHYTMYMVDLIINVYDRFQICFEMYFETGQMMWFGFLNCAFGLTPLKCFCVFSNIFTIKCRGDIRHKKA